MFSSLNNLLHGRMAHRGAIAKGVHTAMSVEACQAVVDEFAGAGNATAVSIQQGKLHVRAANSATAQDLHLRREDLRGACNEKFGYEAVAQVRVST